MINTIIQITTSLILLIKFTLLPLIILMFFGHYGTKFFFKEKLIKNRKINRNYFYNIKQWLLLSILSITFIIVGKTFEFVSTLSYIGFLLLNICIFGYFINYFLISFLKSQTLTNLIYHKWLLVGNAAKVYCLFMILMVKIYMFYVYNQVGSNFFAALIESHGWLNTNLTLPILFLSTISLPILILYNNIKNIRKTMPYSYSKNKYKFMK